MVKDERTLNIYALRNALLIAAYGVYGILFAPRLFTLVEEADSWMTVRWIVRGVVLILYLCYIFLGMTGMLTHKKVKSNHLPINSLFIIIFVDCLFLGFYLAFCGWLDSTSLFALSLSSLIIAGVIIYYFTKFQVKGQEINAIRTMSATLLFCSGGGEIFFHNIRYLSTMLGWFLIWQAFNNPSRPLWKSFVISVFVSGLFLIPRWGEEGSTLLDSFRDYIYQYGIQPMHFTYLVFGIVLITVAIVLFFKLRSFSAESKSVNNNDTLISE